MSGKIFYCKKCDKFTLKQKCSCEEKTITTQPMKYTPDDSKAKYRRIAKNI